MEKIAKCGRKFAELCGCGNRVLAVRRIWSGLSIWRALILQSVFPISELPYVIACYRRSKFGIRRLGGGEMGLSLQILIKRSRGQ